ncbi:hypothetical protein EC573_03230 [Helicobacter pylori]|nr:hypothetical protein EC541_05740 [Helicobacter pylori]RVZ56806.1 hypothetical protein EC573_03230 [Helicobacter pylori]
MYADVRNHKIPLYRNDLKSYLGLLYSNDGFIECSITKKLTNIYLLKRAKSVTDKHALNA